MSPFFSTRNQYLPLSYQGEQRPALHGTAGSPVDLGDGSHLPSPVLGQVWLIPTGSWGARAGVPVGPGGDWAQGAGVAGQLGKGSRPLQLRDFLSAAAGTRGRAGLRKPPTPDPQWTGNRLCRLQESEVAGAGSSQPGRARQGGVPPGGCWLGLWHVPSPHTQMPGQARGEGGTWGIERRPWGLGPVGAFWGGLALGHERRGVWVAERTQAPGSRVPRFPTEGPGVSLLFGFPGRRGNLLQCVLGDPGPHSSPGADTRFLQAVPGAGCSPPHWACICHFVTWHRPHQACHPSLGGL